MQHSTITNLLEIPEKESEIALYIFLNMYYSIQIQSCTQIYAGSQRSCKWYMDDDAQSCMYDVRYKCCNSPDVSDKKTRGETKS